VPVPDPPTEKKISQPTNEEKPLKIYENNNEKAERANCLVERVKKDRHNSSNFNYRVEYIDFAFEYHRKYIIIHC
jgi:hypothetical protein